MPSMPLRRDDVIVGVDTHKSEHVAVLLDGLGGKLAELTIPATTAGFAQLLQVCTEHAGPGGRITAFGVEGTGSYGLGLARFLRRAGHTVREIDRPVRNGQRRQQGKNDAIDAEHAARTVLSGAELATPKNADGSVEVLRLLKIARDTAVKARTAAMIALKATLVTADDALRAELEHLRDPGLIRACADLEGAADLSAPDAAMRHVLSCLARRWLQLNEEIKVHARHLKAQTKALAPALVQAVGVGADIAAEMLITAGDNNERIRSEAAFAKMCGACPIPAGSGQTNGRHRLYRGGNRQANAA
uniref:IS110 family transposase n=1 Tax=Kineococcus sp. SYSU DK007 TaxID=3383128 RepID=UPI003D7C47AB